MTGAGQPVDVTLTATERATTIRPVMDAGRLTAGRTRRTGRLLAAVVAAVVTALTLSILPGAAYLIIPMLLLMWAIRRGRQTLGLVVAGCGILMTVSLLAMLAISAAVSTNDGDTGLRAYLDSPALPAVALIGPVVMLVGALILLSARPPSSASR